MEAPAGIAQPERDAAMIIGWLEEKLSVPLQ